MSLISVIVPVYKVEPYLHRCVDSILAQSFTDFELILVDDGSPDNCGAICDKYALKDERVHVIHQENGGLSAARNAGIDWVFANSDSDWFSFVDSDDWVHQRYLELLYSAVVKNGVKLSQCVKIETDSYIIDQSVVGKCLVVSPEEQYTRWYSAFAWGKLYKREIFQLLRYPVGILYEDVAIWYRILFSLDLIAIVDEPLYYYYQREDSIVNTSWTPRCMSRINAWDAQIVFFRKLNNKRLIQTAVKYYCRIASQEYNAIQRSEKLSDTERNTYSVEISKRLRKVVCRYFWAIRSNAGLKWYVQLSFPICSEIYWTIRGVLNKLKKLMRFSSE